MTKKEQAFVKNVWKFYAAHGRTKLPWRHTKDPYRILVSEVMLQQTQVDRVLPKYQEFLKQFPTVCALQNAPLGDVLRVWQGLGYNRRAKMLHECAKIVVRECGEKFPKSYDVLKSLPGIGSYTASAILAFAYNMPVVMIETNIRTVYLRHFYKEEIDVADGELLRCIAVTVDTQNPREWYYALMDYGTYLKKVHGNPNSRSKHYIKQSKFSGSDREIRGALLRTLAQSDTKLTRVALHKSMSRFDILRIDAQLERLIEEGMVECDRQKLSLPK